MRSRTLLLVAASAIAIPALAQDRQTSVRASQESNAVGPAQPSAAPAETQPATSPAESEGQGASPSSRTAADADLLDLFAMGPPPVEYPDHARRDPKFAGSLDPAQLGLSNPWRGASGAFLSTLMRRMDTPIASRWAHMALRNLLLARARTPRNVNPVDWPAERAWLLLRMGEADAARMLVASIDVDRFTPKMYQVAVQSALASADPSALCPLQSGIEEVEPQIYQLVDAMCAALAGEPEAASSQIDAARRRGRMSGIDISLAQKVIGAASETGRAVTIEWEPVERLNAWRFGLATATGMVPPPRLLADAPAQLRAWHARAPLLAPADRWDSAVIAAGLGVFSSQALIDLQSLIYDLTGPDELAETDAWQLRLAFIGKNEDTRLAAMRRLWEESEDSLQREAIRAMLGRAAGRVVPDADRAQSAVELIASMLAAGYDREAAKWVNVVSRMDQQYADPAWAMLALASPAGVAIDRSMSRITGFISRDDSEHRKRSAFLVAGLAGLGHIDHSTASRLNERYGLRLDRRSRWTRMIDRASALGQAGTVLTLSGTGLQSPNFEAIPPAHLFHIVAALKQTGQDFTARMIAAEALSRT